MKLGEIKLEAVSLMYPGAYVGYDIDDESLERVIFQMKSDPNLEGVMESIVGSINRCFTRIENKDLSELKCIDLPISLCKRVGEGYGIALPKDCLRVERLIAQAYGKSFGCDYDILDSMAVTTFEGQVYTLVYRTKIPRITSATKEKYEISFPMGIEALIPYFIKGELFTQEDKEEAKTSMEVFERDTNNLADKNNPCRACFQVIYSME